MAHLNLAEAKRLMNYRRHWVCWWENSSACIVMLAFVCTAEDGFDQVLWHFQWSEANRGGWALGGLSTRGVLHAGDLSRRSHTISKSSSSYTLGNLPSTKISLRLCSGQSDREKSEGLPVAPFMDRDKVTKPTAQIGFIKFVLIPMFETVMKVRPRNWRNHVYRVWQCHS